MSASVGGLPHVSVVLCTFNGARFLSEQLDSLATQSVPPDRLVLRDDGSTDASVSIVRDWSRGRGIPLVHVSAPAERLGPARSFLTALAAGGPARIHLLCDQDDVWLPTKIERAVRALAPPSAVPRLYAARQQLVDSSLQPLGTSPSPGPLEFTSAIYESQLTGCTMAFDESLRLLLARHVPDHAQMHDWWIYLLASAVGRIHFDDSPTMLYRQHGQNAIGAGPTGFAALKSRLHRTVNAPGGLRSAQLREFRKTFDDLLDPAQRELIDTLTAPDRTCFQRWAAGLSVPISRRSWLSRIGTRLSIMRGRY